MNRRVEKLAAAQKYAVSIRPKVGGFPVLAEVLRQAGVTLNRWSLPSCQAVYWMEDGVVVQQGTPLVNGSHEVPEFNQAALIAAIRRDQEGQSTFPEFLQSAWRAGVVSYDADFVNRKVTYYGAKGDSYEEKFPAVTVPAEDRAL